MMRFAVLAVIAAGFFASGCSDFDKFYNEAKTEGVSKEGASSEQVVVAEVGGRKITKDELMNSVRALPPQQMFLYLSSPEKLKEYLDSYIDQIVLAEEAKRQGYDKRADIRENLEAYKTRLLIQALGEEMEKQTASEEDLLAFYNGNAQKFERIRLSIIFIQTDAAKPDGKEQALAKAESVIKMAKAGRKFETLVEKFSDEPTTKAKGGDTGYVPRGRLPLDIENRIFELSEGEMSEPIEIPNGVYVVKVTEGIKTAPFEEAKAEIELESKKKMFLDYMDKLRAAEKIQVFENELKEVGLNEQTN